MLDRRTLDPDFAALLARGEGLVRQNLTLLRDLQREMGPPGSG